MCHDSPLTPRREQIFWLKGVYADRAPSQLSLLVRGLEDIEPRTFHFVRWRQRRISEHLYRNPLKGLFSVPDLAYAVNIVFSLLALLFVFDSICGEKEAETLKLTLSTSFSSKYFE